MERKAKEQLLHLEEREYHVLPHRNEEAISGWRTGHRRRYSIPKKPDPQRRSMEFANINKQQLIDVSMKYQYMRNISSLFSNRDHNISNDNQQQYTLPLIRKKDIQFKRFNLNNRYSRSHKPSASPIFSNLLNIEQFSKSHSNSFRITARSPFKGVLLTNKMNQRRMLVGQTYDISFPISISHRQPNTNYEQKMQHLRQKSQESQVPTRKQPKRESSHSPIILPHIGSSRHNCEDYEEFLRSNPSEIYKNNLQIGQPVCRSKQLSHLKISPYKHSSDTHLQIKKEVLMAKIQQEFQSARISERPIKRKLPNILSKNSLFLVPYLKSKIKNLENSMVIPHIGQTMLRSRQQPAISHFKIKRLKSKLIRQDQLQRHK